MNILDNELYDSYDELFGGQKKLGGLIRLLMYLLRHDTSGTLKKDKDGYVKVDDLIKHPNIKNPDTVLDDIKTIIDQNKEKGIQMFDLKGTGSSMKIKAFAKKENPAPAARRKSSKKVSRRRKSSKKVSRRRRKSSKKVSRRRRRKSSKKVSRRRRKSSKKVSRRRRRKSSKKVSRRRRKSSKKVSRRKKKSSDILVNMELLG